MADVVIPYVGRERWLTHALAGAGSCEAFLWTDNDVVPDEDTVLADLTVATYAGYADQAVTWETVVVPDVAGEAYSLSSSIEFPLATAGTQDVYGWALVDGAGALLECRLFDAPITVTTTAGVSSYRIMQTLTQAA